MLLVNTMPRIAGLLVGCLGLLADMGCAPSPPAHRALPVTVPFAMDRAGNEVRIDFSVVEGQANLKRRFMVGVDFPQTPDNSIEHAIQRQNIPVQVQIFLVDEGKTARIETQDAAAIMSAANGFKTKTYSSVAKLHLYRTDGKTSNVLIAGFYLTQYGHYVAVVRTMQDLPMFSGVKTELKVDEFYNTGK